MKKLFFLLLLMAVIVLNLDAQKLQVGVNKDKKFNPVNQKMISINKDQEQIAFDSLLLTNNYANYLMRKEIFKYNNFGKTTLTDLYYYNYDGNSFDTTNYRIQFKYDVNQKVDEIKYFLNDTLNQRDYYIYNTTNPQIVEFQEFYFYNPDTVIVNKKEYYLTGERLDTLKYYDGQNNLQNFEVYFYNQWPYPDSIHYYYNMQENYVLSAKDIFEYNTSGLLTIYENYSFDGNNLIPNIKNENIYDENNNLITLNHYYWQEDHWFLYSYEQYTYENNKKTVVYYYYNYNILEFLPSEKEETFYNQNNDIEILIYYSFNNGQWEYNYKFEVTYKPYLVADIFAPEEYFGSNYVFDKIFGYSWQAKGWINVFTYDIYCSQYVPSNLVKKSNMALVIYPNPASKYISIDVPTNVKISIYDINGRLINVQNYNGFGINIENLSCGTYILKAKTPEGSKTQIFIKK